MLPTSLLFVSALVFGSVVSRLDQLKTVESYMDICLLGKNHKSKPSEERGLVSKICSPWAARSCCTAGTALDIMTDSTWLNFDWNHCANLSPKCREYFVMDSCFYSCSPNVGPWLVEDNRKIRNERFKGVPLCRSVCDRWYDACKNDFTCTDKWAENFSWSTGINTCPEGSSCRKFSDVFKNSSTYFCENVFGSFKVADKTDDNCFHFWFDPKYPNPNEAVARRKASEILNVPYKSQDGVKLGGGGGGADSVKSSSLFVMSVSLLVVVSLWNFIVTR